MIVPYVIYFGGMTLVGAALIILHSDRRYLRDRWIEVTSWLVLWPLILFMTLVFEAYHRMRKED